MLKRSFDVFFVDGRSINCEYAGQSSIKGKANWDLYLYSADGDHRTAYGTKQGTRQELMLFVEKLAEFEQK